MSACESLHRMFENPPLPENPTLLETLSSSSETYHTTLTLTRKHSNQHVSNTAPTPPHRNGDGVGFSSSSSERLHRCTEGLGFESSDEVEDSKKGEWWESVREKEGLGLEDCCDGEWRRRRSCREYPPPISCIGRSGKPFVRDNGRFVLKEVWSPNQHFLHAHREDGRLKLHFLLPQEQQEEENDNHSDDDNKYKEEEEDYYDAESVDDEGEEHMGREKDESVTNQVNEEKRD
ncbi:hypothetical protein CR513_54551, partial [Mucuna pruriens]